MDPKKGSGYFLKISNLIKIFNSIKIKSGAHMKSQMEMYFLNLGKNFKMKIRTIKILIMMIKINLM